MAEKNIIEHDSPRLEDGAETDLGSITNDESTIPGGELDPVYEKKAKVLNRAVRHLNPHLQPDEH